METKGCRVRIPGYTLIQKTETGIGPDLNGDTIGFQRRLMMRKTKSFYLDLYHFRMVALGSRVQVRFLRGPLSWLVSFLVLVF